MTCRQLLNTFSTIISYCTNDYRFISKCIEEAKKFSDQIIVVTCDHFFDGTPENRHLLEHTYANHPECQFIEFSYLPDRLYSPYHRIKPNDPEWAKFWAATTRYIGIHYAISDYVLFLDSDEIVEGENCLNWIKSSEYLSYETMKFATYLYGLKPDARAKKVSNLPLLVKREVFKPLLLMNDLERIGAFLSSSGQKKERIIGVDQKPFVHHYSWVRTKEECLWKTKTWGHRGEEDWERLINEAFEGKGEELFGLLEFENVEPYFDPFQVKFPREKIPHANVLKITDRDLFLKTLE